MFNTITSAISYLRTYLPAKESVQNINPKTIAIIGTVFTAFVYMTSKYKALQLYSGLQSDANFRLEAQNKTLQHTSNYNIEKCALNKITISKLEGEIKQLEQTIQQKNQSFSEQIITLTQTVQTLTESLSDPNRTAKNMQKALSMFESDINSKAKEIETLIATNAQQKLMIQQLSDKTQSTVEAALRRIQELEKDNNLLQTLLEHAQTNPILFDRHNTVISNLALGFPTQLSNRLLSPATLNASKSQRPTVQAPTTHSTPSATTTSTPLPLTAPNAPEANKTETEHYW